QGLGGALFEAVEFANGKILNSSLSDYKVPRFSDMPKIDVVLIDRKDLPSSGAGEAGIVCIAPAIRNAILDATGIGLNTLPMLPNGVLSQ
ncbi:MAG: molybdopterin cofactor-binding domain-containing protein, partial [Ginsengibacter sp.]